MRLDHGQIEVINEIMAGVLREKMPQRFHFVLEVTVRLAILN